MGKKHKLTAERASAIERKKLQFHDRHPDRDLYGCIQPSTYFRPKPPAPQPEEPPGHEEPRST